MAIHNGSCNDTKVLDEAFVEGYKVVEALNFL